MILVVDDDEAIVEFLRAALEDCGYRVETAGNGVQAYEHLKHPDCKGMLLDINMPKINGVELLMLMQADDIRVPTIVMAGFDDFDELEMKNFENVVEFLHKPFELQDLLDRVQTHVLPAARKPQAT